MPEVSLGYHCPRCTHPMEEGPFPRVCPYCRHTEYGNPRPVTILLIPHKEGLVGIRRNLADGYGGLALPGGFVNHKEPWRRAGAREAWEEIGHEVHEDYISLFDVRDAEGPNVTIIVGLAPHVRGPLPPFAPNEEVQERVILHRGDELVFPTHQAAMDRYFDQLNGHVRS